MKDLFRVINLDNIKKIGNLKAEAHSQVKSTKYFPIYKYNDKVMIYKPLSKTKPLTTPLFAYSEVFWSHIINKYFDSNAPLYYLAMSKDIEKEQPKYYNQGVLVESLTPNNETLINLYDYFIINPELIVNIKDYINYCMCNYDYTKILQSSFIKNNKEIGEGLAYQILLSILRQDQNFHYENINFIQANNKLLLAPPIDFEFSTPFLYPDNIRKYEEEQIKYMLTLEIKYEEDELSKFFKSQGLITGSKNSNNITQIVKLYPNIVLKFIKNLETLIKDLPQIEINDNDNYIGSLNSDYWEVGHAYFKDNDLEKYEELKEKIKLNNINKEKTFKKISKDILEYSIKLCLILKTYLFAYYNGIDNLEDLTIKEILTKLNINDNVTIEDIDLDTKKLKLKNNN